MSDNLTLAGLSFDDLLGLVSWSESLEHTLSAGESALLAKINAALQGETSRWTAFTDLELITLRASIDQAAFEGGYMEDYRDLDEDEQALRDEIADELKRRDDSKPLAATRAYLRDLPGVVSVDIGGDGTLQVATRADAPDSTRVTIREKLGPPNSRRDG